MNLHKFLLERHASDNPVRVGLIGAGKFGTMFLNQARLTFGLHVVAIADLFPDKVADTCKMIEWEDERLAATSVSEAVKSGTTFVTDDAISIISHPVIEVVIEATGDPNAGILHCVTAIGAGKHIVMVNVEADAVVGPLLARKAAAADVVYSLAWGDQPALICEHVDWARTSGFKVVCAGKGTRYLPEYHKLTPDSIWGVLKDYLKVDQSSDINPKMFNSFLDGTKSAIEMSAVCNATGLTPQADGLGFPPSNRFELATICKPRAEGGLVSHSGTTEVVSSLNRDGTDVPEHLAMGTYVVIEAETNYTSENFRQYHMMPDSSGRFAALYRPIHMIGLELGVSVASAVCRKESTGCPTGFRSDVAATTKRQLKKGEILDGEGGFMVWGRQIPAQKSLDLGCLPLGLASGVAVTRNMGEGEMLTWSDVEIDSKNLSVRLRKEMEAYYT